MAAPLRARRLRRSGGSGTMTNTRKAQWFKCQKTGVEYLHALHDGADYFCEGVKALPIGEPFDVNGPPYTPDDGHHLVRRPDGSLTIVHVEDGRFWIARSQGNEFNPPGWEILSRKPLDLFSGVKT